MTIEEWLPLMQGVLVGLVLPIDWVVRRLKRPERHRVDPIEPPLPPHAGGYRTSPRPQAMVPRRAPWWRLAWWWVRGGARRLRYAIHRRRWNGALSQGERESRFGFRAGWRLPIVDGGALPTARCHICGAVGSEPCDAGLHSWPPQKLNDIHDAPRRGVRRPTNDRRPY